MRKPVARATKSTPKAKEKPSGTSATTRDARARAPKAFAPEKATTEIVDFAQLPQTENLPELSPAPVSKKPNWAIRLALGAGGVLVSLGLGLMAERLVRDLFTRYEWLGWVGTAALALFVLAVLVLLAREFMALRRLNNMDKLREQAECVLRNNLPAEGRTVVAHLDSLYSRRPDLARARQHLDADISDQFDGADMIGSAERHLMSPLDARARALTAASARRVAIVTAISPRALVDILFVSYESIKLSRAIAALYGVRPGLIGGWRLAGAVLSHLAVTGGVALGDSVIQQLLGHGLAAKLSARLGEGLVNGLMTVRVGIAAMGVTRPLPFDQLKQPKVVDFATDLAKISQSGKTE